MTKQQMALECTQDHHKAIKRLKYKEIRGNLLKTYNQYMMLDRRALSNECLIARHYNMDMVQFYKVHKPKPSEVEELREQVRVMAERLNSIEKGD